MKPIIIPIIDLCIQNTNSDILKSFYFILLIDLVKHRLFNKQDN